ncbi:MAG: hypothetical protein V1743_07150 [Nanoarchaeota archaeon]
MPGEKSAGSPAALAQQEYAQAAQEEQQQAEKEQAIVKKLVTPEEVDAAYANLPQQLKEETTKEKLAESLATNKLMLQEAEKKSLTATQQEVDAYVDNQRRIASLDAQAFTARIESQGYTMEEYTQAVENLVTASKLLESELRLSQVNASEQEITTYLQDNRQEFQDFFEENDPALLDALKTRIGQKLTKEKQDALVKDYVASLKEDAIARG